MSSVSINEIREKARQWLGNEFDEETRAEVRQMLEQAETPDVYALLPPGQTYSRADEMFSRDGPQEPLPRFPQAGRGNSEYGYGTSQEDSYLLVMRNQRNRANIGSQPPRRE